MLYKTSMLNEISIRMQEVFIPWYTQAEYHFTFESHINFVEQTC